MPDPIQHSPAGVRFNEAIDYLKGKLPEASLRWDDLAGPVHAKVFTVAGATTADLARDFHQAISAAVTEGRSLGQFRKDFDRIVQEHGWSYRGSRGWRSAIIYNTNMRSAHMAGRWQQLQSWQASGEEVWLQYRTAGDARVRPLHRAWNGLTYPLNDPFWSTHYPPNGWNCRCTVRAYSAGQMARRGIQASEPYKVEYREVIDKYGEIKDRVPVGIDPGWDHNVGKSWIAPDLALGEKIARLPAPLRGPIAEKTISPAFERSISERWKVHQSAVKAGTAAPTDAQILGFLDRPTIEGLAREAGESLSPSAAAAPSQAPTAIGSAARPLPLKSSAIAAFDTPPGSWPAAWVDDLPAHLRAYRAIAWDRRSATLLVIPQADLPGAAAGTVPTITLQPNVRTRYGSALAITATGSARLTDLQSNPSLQVLSGRLR